MHSQTEKSSSDNSKDKKLKSDKKTKERSGDKAKGYYCYILVTYYENTMDFNYLKHCINVPTKGI